MSNSKRRHGLIGFGGISATTVLMGVTLSACFTSAAPVPPPPSIPNTTVIAPASGSATIGTAAQLQDLESSLLSEVRSSYKVTYANGGVSTTIEQSGSKLRASVGGSAWVFNGSAVYACSVVSSSGALSGCKTGPSNSGRLINLFSAYSPQTVAAELQRIGEQFGAQAPISIWFTNETLANQRSVCVSYAYQSVQEKYCVTNSGVLAGEYTRASTFQMTSSTSNPPASDFVIH